MEIIETIGLITINETLFIELATFLIFMAVMNRIMFGPLQSVIADREAKSESIRLATEDAEAALTETNRKLERMEAQVRQEATDIRENLESEGAKEADQVLLEARTEMAKRTREAQAAVEKQITAARESIERESVALAASIMQKVLEREVSP